MILFNVLINYLVHHVPHPDDIHSETTMLSELGTKSHVLCYKCNLDVILPTNPLQTVHVTGVCVCVCVFAGAPDRYKWTGRNGCSVLFGSAQAKTLHVPLRAPQPQLPSAGRGERPDRHPQHPQHHQVNAHAPVQWPYPAQDVLFILLPHEPAQQLPYRISYNN